MDSSDAPASEASLARAIVAAVRAVPGVADLSPTRSVELATYGAREKVQGIVINATDRVLDVEVHVCAQYSESLVLAELADRVRNAIRQSVDATRVGRTGRIDVVFDDVRVEQDLSW
jgi:hypothetical protein